MPIHRITVHFIRLKHDRQCTYEVILRRIRATIVEAEKKKY